MADTNAIIKQDRRKLDEVIIRDDLYPRFETDPALIEVYKENIEVLPPIEVNQHNHLIDGKHRLTAYRAVDPPLEYIPVVVTETASDAELLLLACERNASHGAQLANADKQRMTREIYSRAADKDRPALKKRLQRVMSVGERSIQRWTSRIDKDAAAERKEQAFALWLACYTQDEIAERLNTPRQTIYHMAEGFAQIRHLADLGKTSASFGDFTPPLYNVWKWKDKNNKVTHYGNSEVSIVENLLHAYTEPLSDIVVDPFAGGGSTIDICRKRFRRYHVSDLTPIVARENEIRQNDITAGLPELKGRWGDVKLVYLDPPYWKQSEGEYGDSPSNFANMDVDTFHAELAGVVNRFADKLPTGAKIALLIQPTQWKAPGRGFVDHTMAVNSEVDLPIVQRVQCPYESQQATPQMVNWAKENKQWLVLSRELTIWEVR